MGKDLKEYFRSTSKDSVFSGGKIFQAQDELWMTNASGRYLIYRNNKPEENAERIWFNGSQARIPSHWGFKDEKIIITELGDGIWDLRLASTEEIQAYQWNRYTGNIHSSEYFVFSKMVKEHLHIGEEGYILNVICINNIEDGSYMVIRAEKRTDKKEIEPANKYLNFRLDRFTYSTVLQNNAFYLPKPFRDMTGIRDNSYVPEWIRSDGAVIIEGRPGVCKKCGKHMSRYKAPISDICRNCNPKQLSLFEKQIVKYMDFFE